MASVVMQHIVNQIVALKDVRRVPWLGGYHARGWLGG